MKKFIPGKVLKRFKTRSGKDAILRYSKWEDLGALTKFVNEISKENVYVAFSGEQLSKKEETEWLANMFRSMENNWRAHVLCFVGKELAGGGSIGTKNTMRRKSQHVAAVGIMIRKKYRGDGIGTVIMKEFIEQAKTFLKGIKLVELSVFEDNKPAIKLYKELGFKEVGKIPKGLKHRGKYNNEILMILSL